MELVQLFMLAAQEQAKQRSPYLREFRREHAVIPSVAKLPRIVRAFIGG